MAEEPSILVQSPHLSWPKTKTPTRTHREEAPEPLLSFIIPGGHHPPIPKPLDRDLNLQQGWEGPPLTLALGLPCQSPCLSTATCHPTGNRRQLLAKSYHHQLVVLGDRWMAGSVWPVGCLALVKMPWDKTGEG